MKKIIISIFMIFIITSCGKNELGMNINNTDKLIQTGSILEETNTGSIQEEKDYKIIDLTKNTKSELICSSDEYESENCDLYLDFGKYGKFKIYTYFDGSFSGGFDKSLFETGFGGKAYFNEKYNSIFLSFGITGVGNNIITNSLKIDLSTKKLIKFESTLGNDFYFKDIDTIIPKFISTSETSFEEVIEEGKAIILGEKDNSKKENLSGIDFIKNYYKVMGEKDFNELANITEGNTFEQLKDWYKNLEKVEIIDIKDLGNNKYKIVVDLYEKIINDNGSAFGHKSMTQYIENTFLYSRTTIEKEIINGKLKTIKGTNKTINLPRVKVETEYSLDGDSFNQYKIFEKKLGNGKIFELSISPQEGCYRQISLQDKNKYVKSSFVDVCNFIGFFGIKNGENSWFETHDKELINSFNQASDDMIEKTLFQ